MSMRLVDKKGYKYMNNVKPEDNIYAIVINRGRAFYNKADLAKEMGCSKNKIDVLIPGVRRQIEKGRYSPYVISGNLYSFPAFLDYNKYRKDLEDPIRCKYVPDFRPQEIVDLSGYHTRVIHEEIVGQVPQ